MKVYLTYDDVSIIPGYSDIDHREFCDTTSWLTKNIKINLPVISSPMDTVTGEKMLEKMSEWGGIGIIHRFQEAYSIIDTVVSFRKKHPEGLMGVAIGVREYHLLVKEVFKEGCNIVLLDVAHGHHALVEKAISEIKNISSDIQVIAGNIATSEAARDLIKWGADALRCGIGGGSMCSTRLQCGVGVPMITCIEEIYAETKGIIPLIADGGIRYTGDIAKAIAAGADSVMLGSLLAGTTEAPGVILRDGMSYKRYKLYRGSASYEAKLDRNETRYVEGYSTRVPYKGDVDEVLKGITEGIKGSMGLVGAKTMKEFKDKARLIQVSRASAIEALPHGLINSY